MKPIDLFLNRTFSQRSNWSVFDPILIFLQKPLSIIGKLWMILYEFIFHGLVLGIWRVSDNIGPEPANVEVSNC